MPSANTTVTTVTPSRPGHQRRRLARAVRRMARDPTLHSI